MNLAKVYREEGKYADAEPLYKQALDLRVKTFGDRDMRVAATLRNYAILMDKMGNATKAADLNSQAEKIEEQ
jgi:tetratricopeptide (TPR) repeat protein